jgi:hypothetical protein
MIPTIPKMELIAEFENVRKFALIGQFWYT